MDIYRYAKFSHDPSRGFFSPYARNCTSKCLLGFFFLHRSHKMLLCQRHLIDKRHSAVCRSAELAISQIFWLTATHAAAGCQPLQPPGKLIFIVINILQLTVPFQCRQHCGRHSAVVLNADWSLCATPAQRAAESTITAKRLLRVAWW